MNAAARVAEVKGGRDRMGEELRKLQAQQIVEVARAEIVEPAGARRFRGAKPG